MNPFLINNYISPKYFCDRENETDTLIQHVRNRNNTVFFAQRRIGKTALIKHVFYLLKKNKTDTIYIDILPTNSLKEFADALSSAIYAIFPIQKSIGKRFWEHIKLLRPLIKVNELSGLPEVTLDISQPAQIERSITQLLKFLDQHNKPVVIAIDEFQQILQYPEKNVEAILRTVIQTLKNISFVFLGSDRKIMLEIFNNSKRPFFASSSHINLEKIDADSYASFIKKTFNANGIKMDNEAVESILQLTQRHTYYTQRLCHEIFASNEKNINHSIVVNKLLDILKQNEPIYYQYRSMLTKTQWALLDAVAKESPLKQPYAQLFIRKHNLSTSSSVKRAMKALEEKDLIYYNTLTEIPFYEVQDKFLMRWLQYR